MGLPRIIAVAAGLSLWLAPELAAAQQALGLKAGLDDSETGSVGDPVDGWKTTTTVNELPVQEPAPPRRIRKVENPYEPTGVPIGSGGLRLYPTLTIGGVGTSNVRRTSSNRKADAGINLRPAFRMESDWIRHSWTVNADGDFDFYARESDLRSRDFNFSQDLRLDVRRSTRLDLTGTYSLSQSGLEDSNVPATAKGYQTEHNFGSVATLVHEVGAFDIQLRGGATYRKYGDVDLNGGGTQDNGDRDYIEPTLSLRTTYADPPAIKPFVEVGYAPRIHTRKLDRSGLKRDSQGFSASAGLRFDETPIWTGEVALTYLHRNYEDSALHSNNVAGATGSLTWSPTDLARLTASLGTTISEATAAASSGARNWTFGLDGNVSVRENVDVFAGAGLEVSRASGGTDLTYDANAGVSWKLNPMLAWTAGYDFTWLDAAGSGRDYTEHRVTTGITLSR